MTVNPLNRIMSPSSIAIAGASNNITTMGTIQLFNLLNSGWTFHSPYNSRGQAEP